MLFVKLTEEDTVEAKLKSLIYSFNIKLDSKSLFYSKLFANKKLVQNYLLQSQGQYIYMVKINNTLL